jgi:hypothetical protein
VNDTVQVDVAAPVEASEQVVPAGKVPAVVLNVTVPVGAPAVALPTTVAVHVSPELELELELEG